MGARRVRGPPLMHVCLFALTAWVWYLVSLLEVRELPSEVLPGMQREFSSLRMQCASLVGFGSVKKVPPVE